MYAGLVYLYTNSNDIFNNIRDCALHWTEVCYMIWDNMYATKPIFLNYKELKWFMDTI